MGLIDEINILNLNKVDLVWDNLSNFGNSLFIVVVKIKNLINS